MNVIPIQCTTWHRFIFVLLITVMESEERIKFFLQTVPCLLNFCKAFPPLCEDVTTLLSQVGRICVSQLAATTNMSFFGEWRLTWKNLLVFLL